MRRRAGVSPEQQQEGPNTKMRRIRHPRQVTTRAPPRRACTHSDACSNHHAVVRGRHRRGAEGPGSSPAAGPGGGAHPRAHSLDGRGWTGARAAPNKAWAACVPAAVGGGCRARSPLPPA